MSIEDRKTGWRMPIFNYKFREILTHTMFRYQLCCPIYCCMPDHIHLLWIGIGNGADQRKAAKYLRKQLGPILKKLGAQFQKQPYDHVLSKQDRDRHAFENVADYIARNPERGGLVKVNCGREYGYSGCLLPGYPELTFWQTDFWPPFWRIYHYLTEHGLVQGKDDD